MKKSVLVTGGAGYIGSHTTQALLREGFKVIVYDNLSTGFQSAIPSEAIFVKGDIFDEDLLGNTLLDYKADAVIHFAAKIIVPESVSNPIEYYRNNTCGVLSLLRICQKVKLDKIIFSSTAAVYGNASDKLIDEHCPIAPLNPYGQSKYFSECMIQDAGQAFPLQSMILRYFNVAGAALDGGNGQRSMQSTHLIKLASKAALGSLPYLNIYGTDYPTQDGTAIRDYIHVEDLAEIHVLAYNYLAKGGKSDILNCGYGKGFSVQEVLQVMKKVSGNDFKCIESPRRPGDGVSLVANNEKLQKILSWKPRYNDLSLICKTALDWEKKWQPGP